MPLNSNITRHVMLVFALALAPAIPSASASTWTGGDGNWSSDATPGWNGTGVPNAIGAVATLPASGDTIINDVNPTIGTLELVGSSSGTRQIHDGTFTLNQDDAGAGHATISNAATHSGNRLSFNSAITFVLADDLLITNTGGSTGSYSIGASSTFTGSGNLTIYNVSNSTTQGPVSLTGPNSFTGSVTVLKGALNFTNTALGDSSNLVTLGSTGNGDATLMSTGSVTDLPNNIVVAAGSGGTLLLGSSHTGTSTSTYSGGITLSDNLTITSVKTGGGTVAFTGIISGSGSITKIDSGSITLSGVNTYTGDTTINGGTVELTNSGELRFNIQNANVSNQIAGSGAAILDGLFRIDISALTDVAGTWNLIDVATLTETFDTNFGLAFVGGPAFTNDGGGIYTSTDWTFDTATGNLTLIPEPATFILLAMSGLLAVPTRKRTAR